MPQRLISILGLFVLMGIAFLMSNNRRKIRLRVIIWGIALQALFAWFILGTPIGGPFFKGCGAVITGLLNFTNDGARFVFGSKLIDGSWSFIFVTQVLPTIIFVSSLMAVLYHVKIMQVVVLVMAKIMQWTMGVSGAEALSCATNVFVGQTEAPLVVRPYVPKMTNSELMVLMTGGFATIAGGVLAAYAAFLKAAGLHSGPGHLLAASIISAPAAILMAKIIFPETEQSITAGSVKMDVPQNDVNVLDAAARGASEGVSLVINVAAMLLAFVALIAMFDYLIGPGVDWILVKAHATPWNLSIAKVLGYLFWPIAWVMGVPTVDCLKVGNLLGQKIVLTEFIAYTSLTELVKTSAISLRAQVISTYALCGFANFASIAIQLGGIGGIAPNRRHDLAKLGLRAMIGGALASWMTATIAGIFV